MTADVVYHVRNRYWLDRSKVRCSEGTTAGRERVAEDVLFEIADGEGRKEQRGSGSKSCRVERKLWGFGPGYFSGGLKDKVER